MRLIERYLLGQMLRPILLALAALIGISLLRQSLQALNVIVQQHQTTGVFLELIVLAMPALVSMILPVALLIAVLAALNRLQSDQELVAIYASGAGRSQVMTPVFFLAAIAALVSLAVNLWVQPAANRHMRAVVETARADLATALVRPGAFSEPGEGFTIYVRSVDRAGVLHDIFINQIDPNTGHLMTYQAAEGQITGGAADPKLLLRKASAQWLNNGAFDGITTDTLPVDLSGFFHPAEKFTYEASDRYLNELFHPDLSQKWEQENQDNLLAEGHSRLSSPLYNLAFVAIALAAIVGGGFSRLGYGKRIALAGATAALVRILGFAVQAACDGAPALNVLQYLVPLGALALALCICLREAPRPARRKAAA